MVNCFTEYDSEILHRIMEVRRSIQDFENIQPTRENIISILKSGLWAPFDRKNISLNKDTRKFFVLTSESDKLLKISKIIKNKILYLPDEPDKNLCEEVKNAPCIVIVAEKRGIQYIQRQSLDYVMENMWLKSVSLNIGFRIMPQIEYLNDDEEFSKVLELECGEYAFSGCIIGYPKYNENDGKRPHIYEVVKWL